MRKVVDWMKWEFGRPIEVTPIIRFITIERFVKAFILIAGGIALLVASHKTNLHEIAQDLQTQLNLSPGRSWWRGVYSDAVVRFGRLPKTRTEEIAAGAVLYGLLEGLEGVGLALRRRWAEYLVLVATALFLPLEITEIFHKPTLFKVGALLLNIAIIAYLVWRKRLFLERPSHERADETEPVPADIR